MKFKTATIVQSAMLLLAMLLTACGSGGSSGGGGGGTPPAKQMGGAMQGVALNLTPTVSTLAGAFPGADGTGAGARFSFGNDGSSIVSDGTNLYVADTWYNKIRKIVIATGVVTTLAGTGELGAADGPGATASFSHPTGITTDGTSLYVTDYGNTKIRKIVIASGEVSSFTGTANTVGAASAVDGAAATATFSQPYGITTDGTNLYVTDSGNHKIRKIVIASGEVSSFTGAADTASAASAVDGAAATATFNYPMGITTDGNNLYVADLGNNKIRKIVISSGVVSSVTGNANTAGTRGAQDGDRSVATFRLPRGITTDGTNLYVADTQNNKIRVVVIASGAVSSFTGAQNTQEVAGAADGAGSVANFSWPSGITIVGGHLYVTDGMGIENFSSIRTISISTAVVSTLAGNGHTSADGTGASAAFLPIKHSTTDGTNLYVADRYNRKIRKIVIATGVVTTLAGTGASGAADGPATSATFSDLAGITTDGVNLYAVDMYNCKIRKIVIATGEVSSFTSAANATCAVGGVADGAASTASFRFDSASGITTDGANLYVADTGNHKIRKIVIATGEVSSFTGVANTQAAPGAADGGATSATFWGPSGITTDGTALYVVDGTNHKIRKIEIATGSVSSVTGTPNTSMAFSQGAADGPGVSATFRTPIDITTDGASLYVTDVDNHKIRKIDISTGVVSSVTGLANAASTAGQINGPGATAKFAAPYGITTDGSSLFVSDGQTIRVIK